MGELYKNVIIDELTYSYCKDSKKVSFYIHKNQHQYDKCENFLWSNFLWYSHKCTITVINESNVKHSTRKLSSIPKSPSTQKLFSLKLPFSLPKRTFTRRSKRFSEGWNYEVCTTLSPCHYHHVMLQEIKWLPKKINENEKYLFVSLNIKNSPILYKEVMQQTPIIYNGPCFNKDYDQTIESSFNDSIRLDTKQEGAIAKLVYTTEKLIHLESCIDDYSMKLVSLKLSYEPVVIWDVYEDTKGFSTSHIQLTESCESKLLKIKTPSPKNIFSDFLFSFSKNRLPEASCLKNQVVKENIYDDIPDDMVVVDIIGDKIQNTPDKLIENCKEINIDTNTRRAFFRKEPKSNLVKKSESAIDLYDKKCPCKTNQTDSIQKSISNEDFNCIKSFQKLYEGINNERPVYNTTDAIQQIESLYAADEENNQNRFTENETIGNVINTDDITNDLTNNNIDYDLVYNYSTNDFILNDILNDIINYIIIDVINGIISDIIITNSLLTNDTVSNGIVNNNIINVCTSLKKIPPNVKNKSFKTKTTESDSSRKNGSCNGKETKSISSLNPFAGDQFDWRENKQFSYNEMRFNYNNSSDIVKSRVYTPRAIQMYFENEVKSIERERQKVSYCSEKSSITLETKRGAKKKIVLTSVVPDNSNKKVDSPSLGRIAIPTAFEER